MAKGGGMPPAIAPLQRALQERARAITTREAPKRKAKAILAKAITARANSARAAKHLARATKALASNVERSDTRHGSAAEEDRLGPTASERSSTGKQRKPSGLVA